jgi:hypothetical protein
MTAQSQRSTTQNPSIETDRDASYDARLFRAVLGELYIEASEAAIEAYHKPEDNFGQAKVRRWLKSEEFQTLCHCAEVEEIPVKKFFETIITADPDEAKRLAGVLQDMLREWDVCEAERERNRDIRIEYRVQHGLKLLKKDHEYIANNREKMLMLEQEGKEAKRRRLAERGLAHLQCVTVEVEMHG